MFFLKTFLILLLFWVVLSGMFDAFHLSLGVLSAALVSFWSRDLLFRESLPGGARGARRTALRFFRWRHLRYFAWLQREIIAANFQVLYLAFHPRMRELIEPRLFWYESRLESDFAKFILANSITLTPGTVTVRIAGNRFLVHAISPQSAGDLMQRGPGKGAREGAEMERQVRRIFEEDS